MIDTRTLAPVIAAAQEGDAAVLDHLLRACHPDVRRYAYRHCLISDIDDAVQEALLILSRRLRSLRALAAFPGWLFTIVRRECRRLERRQFGLDALDEARMEEWLATCPDEVLRVDLVHVLESLPAHYREVVLLRDFAGLTIRALAARLVLSAMAVRGRLHRAQARAGISDGMRAPWAAGPCHRRLVIPTVAVSPYPYRPAVWPAASDRATASAALMPSTAADRMPPA